MRAVYSSGKGNHRMRDETLARWLEAYNNPAESVRDRQAREVRKPTRAGDILTAVDENEHI